MDKDSQQINFNDPEINALSKKYTLHKTDDQYYFTWNEKKDLETDNYIVRPYKLEPSLRSDFEINNLHFLKNYTSPDGDQESDIVDLYAKFEIKKGTRVSGRKILDLQKYKELLFDQIKNKVPTLHNYDIHLSEILKVYLSEVNLGYINKMRSYKTKNNQLNEIATLQVYSTLENLIKLFQFIRNGASSEKVKVMYIPKYLPKYTYVSNTVYNSTIFGLTYFLRAKDPHLKEIYRVAKEYSQIDDLLDLNLTGKFEYSKFIGNMSDSLRTDVILNKLADSYLKRDPKYSKAELLIALNIIQQSNHVKQRSKIIYLIFENPSWPDSLKDSKDSKTNYKRLDRLIEFYDTENQITRN